MRQDSKYWDLLPIDQWIEPQGDVIGNLFNKVCKKCPDFYDFGLQLAMIEHKNETKNPFFIGETHDTFSDLLLGD